jgi:hypothetical protein
MADNPDDPVPGRIDPDGEPPPDEGDTPEPPDPPDGDGLVA